MSHYSAIEIAVGKTETTKSKRVWFMFYDCVIFKYLI